MSTSNGDSAKESKSIAKTFDLLAQSVELRTWVRTPACAVGSLGGACSFKLKPIERKKNKKETIKKTERKKIEECKNTTTMNRSLTRYVDALGLCCIISNIN